VFHSSSSRITTFVMVLTKVATMQSMLSVSLSLQSHWHELCAEQTLQFAAISNDFVSAQESVTHGLGLVARTAIEQGTVITFYPVHALGDTTNSLAPEDGSAYFDTATSRPYRVQPSHGSLAALGLDDLWIDANPALPHADGWLGHLVNDACVCEGGDEDGIVAYYECCRARSNAHLIPFGDDGTAPLMCYAATRNIEAGEEILGQYGHEYWLTRGGRRVPAVKNTEAVKSAAEPWKSLLVSGQLRVADRYEQEAAALAWLFEQSREALAQGQGAGVTSTTRQERTRSAADKGGGRASGSSGTSSDGSPSASRGFGSAPPGKRATRKKQ
jgi:hypothetical protein